MQRKKFWWTIRWLLIAFIIWTVIDQTPRWIEALFAIWWLYPGPSPFENTDGGNRNAA